MTLPEKNEEYYNLKINKALAAIRVPLASLEHNMGSNFNVKT